MELPLRSMIVLIIVVIVLVIMSFFITTRSSGEIEKGEAQRIFSTVCQSYKLQQCPWSATKDGNFADFFSACRQIYGDHRDKFSCLYSLCQACKEFEPTPADVTCAAISESCEANQKLGLSTAACCANFRGTCAGVRFDSPVC